MQKTKYETNYIKDDYCNPETFMKKG